jgi:23S rRNA (uracil1939-C5)-methyltransferase
MSDEMIYEIELTAAAYGGEAIGRLPDGKAVFVPYALPGERVRARVTDEKRGHARAELLEVLRPAQERIVPRCKHFAVCGGCHYQHLGYEDQLKLKTRILRDQLTRIARIENPPLRPIVPSPRVWNYRNTLQFHLTAEGRPGFQAANSHTVVPIQECHLPEAALNEAWPQLDIEALPGLERVELRLGAEDDLLVSLISSRADLPEFDTDLPLSMVFLGPQGRVVLAGEDYTFIEVTAPLGDCAGRAFRVSAGSFFQVNTLQAQAMVQHLRDTLPLTPHTRLLDVYCGVGLFSALLASQVAEVIGVELSAAACEDYAFNLDEFEHVSLYQGSAENVLPGLEMHLDVAIVDPPRAGVERQALDALLRAAPPVLAYVSCDPTTLARDTRWLLDGGYNLEQVTPFDLFPHTFHIESISIFKK